MSNIKLDFKKFKHLKSDEKSTTLQHPDGHTITLAHNKLDKNNQQQLKALAGAKDQDKQPKEMKMADGGAVYAPEDQPAVIPEYLSPEAPTMAEAVVPREGYFGTNNPAIPVPQSETAEVMIPDTSTPLGRQQLAIDATRAGMSVPEYLKAQGRSESENVDPIQAQQKVVDATRAGLSVPEMDAQLASKSEGLAGDITKQPESEPMSQEAAPTPIAKASGMAEQAPAQVQQKAPEPAQEFLAEDKAWQQDLANGHITPKTYESMFASKSTLGKIGTMFGLMVSGLGSGMSGQKNMLMEMMNKEINDDIEAQKASKSNALNFRQLAEQHLMNSANMKHLGTQDKLALDGLSQQLAGRAAFHKLMTQTQSMPEGPMKMQALQTLGMISQGLDAKAVNVADMLHAKQALYQGMAGGPSNGNSEQEFQSEQRRLRLMGREDLAKDNESKYFPQLHAKSSIPLTAEDRNQLSTGIGYGKQLQRFMDWTTKNSGSLSPSKINEGKALAAELQGAYRKATDGGVYKEGEQHFISSVIDSDPTKFFSKIRVLPQLKALSHEHDVKMRDMLSSKGFNPNSLPATQEASGPVMGKDGRMYTKSADGKYMIPVK